MRVEFLSGLPYGACVVSYSLANSPKYCYYSYRRTFLLSHPLYVRIFFQVLWSGQGPGGMSCAFGRSLEHSFVFFLYLIGEASASAAVKDRPGSVCVLKNLRSTHSSTLLPLTILIYRKISRLHLTKYRLLLLRTIFQLDSTSIFSSWLYSLAILAKGQRGFSSV